MPLSRAALYGQGEDLHIACWPGNLHNTQDITPFLAKEGRSYSVSVSSTMTREDISETVPYAEKLYECFPEILANGGSCVAAPDGSWVLEPLIGAHHLRYAQLDPSFVRRERQNFDPAGHYSRPDVTRLHVNRERHQIADFSDSIQS